jgi:Protein of unknown function (DUF3761)
VRGVLVGVAVAAALLLVGGSAAGGAVPPGATARCADGTYSFSKHRSGTCSHHGGVAQWLASRATVAPPDIALVGRTVLLGPRSRTSGCVRGPLPDRRCSPGAYYSKLTKAVLCAPTFRTTAIRNVPESEKFAVEQEYGMVPRAYGRTIEIDHIVSLELGGSNDIANLFPEPGSGAESYHVKDKLENRLHAMVCAGQIGLRQAQTGIARDWHALDVKVFGG